MDFGTMRQKLRARQYRYWRAFVEDFELMCSNAMTYNQKRSRVHRSAMVILRAGKKALQNRAVEGRLAIMALHPDGKEAAEKDDALHPMAQPQSRRGHGGPRKVSAVAADLQAQPSNGKGGLGLLPGQSSFPSLPSLPLAAGFAAALRAPTFLGSQQLDGDLMGPMDMRLFDINYEEEDDGCTSCSSDEGVARKRLCVFNGDPSQAALLQKVPTRVSKRLAHRQSKPLLGDVAKPTSRNKLAKAEAQMRLLEMRMNNIRTATEQAAERLKYAQAPGQAVDALDAAATGVQLAEPLLSPLPTSNGGGGSSNHLGRADGNPPAPSLAVPEPGGSSVPPAVPLNAPSEVAAGPAPMDWAPGQVDGGTREAGRQFRRRRVPFDSDLAFPAILSHPMFAGLAGIRAPDQAAGVPFRMDTDLERLTFPARAYALLTHCEKRLEAMKAELQQKTAPQKVPKKTGVRKKVKELGNRSASKVLYTRRTHRAVKGKHDGNDKPPAKRGYSRDTHFGEFVMGGGSLHNPKFVERVAVSNISVPTVRELSEGQLANRRAAADAMKVLAAEPMHIPQQILDALRNEVDEGSSDEDTSDEAYIAKHQEAENVERLRNTSAKGGSMQKRPPQSSRPKVPSKPSRGPSFGSAESRAPAPLAVLPTAAATDGGTGTAPAPAVPADANGGNLPVASAPGGLAASAGVVSLGVMDTDKQRRSVQPLGLVPQGAPAGKKPRGRPPGTAKSGKRARGGKGRRPKVGRGRGRASGGAASPDDSQDSLLASEAGEMADGVLSSALPALTEVDVNAHATVGAGVPGHANGSLTPEANRPSGAG